MRKYLLGPVRYALEKKTRAIKPIKFYFIQIQ